jgi:hypothetical protein
VTLFALAIGQPAYGEEVRGLEESYAIRQIEADASIELVGNSGQAGRLEARPHRHGEFGHLII